MNLQLSEKFTSFVNDCVETGLYQNQSEVMREALRRMMREERETKTEHGDLARKMIEGRERVNKQQPSKKVLEALKQSREDEKNNKLIKYDSAKDLIADI